MVYVQGTARIRHAETAEIYEIDADQIDFEAVASDERGMGPETTYSAVVVHPQLGQLLWNLWEYPVGAENHRETMSARTSFWGTSISVSNTNRLMTIIVRHGSTPWFGLAPFRWTPDQLGERSPRCR